MKVFECVKQRKVVPDSISFPMFFQYDNHFKYLFDYIGQNADDQAPPDNVIEKLDIQILSPKPPVDETDKATLKSISLADVTSEKESKKDKKLTASKKSPRKSTARSGGSKAMSKASIKSRGQGQAGWWGRLQWTRFVQTMFFPQSPTAILIATCALYIANNA